MDNWKAILREREAELSFYRARCIELSTALDKLAEQIYELQNPLPEEKDDVKLILLEEPCTTLEQDQKSD